jgi:hypothetical protein
MTVNTGRTVGKYFIFKVDNSAGSLCDIAVSSINGIGVSYPQVDVSALQDAMKGFLPGQPDATLTITGPFDTAVYQAPSATSEAAKLSGSHTILSPLVGATTPLGFGCYVGMRQYWVAGEPVYGISGTTANGVLLYDYTVDLAAATYSATFKFFPGSAAPAWGSQALA